MQVFYFHVLLFNFIIFVEEDFDGSCDGVSLATMSCADVVDACYVKPMRALLSNAGLIIIFPVICIFLYLELSMKTF